MLSQTGSPALMRILLPLMCCVLISLSAQAETAVYRWVDANGRVHFGDPASAPQGARALRAGPLTTSAAPPQPDADPAMAVEACESARTQLNTYQSAERIIESDALGQQREFSGAEREQLIARAEMAAVTACEGQAADEGGE